MQQPTTEQVTENNIMMPVTVKENDAARQIIIKEEGSNGTSVKVYYLTFEDGNWILQPQWIFTAKELNSDSIPALSTDSIRVRIKKSTSSQQ